MTMLKYDGMRAVVLAALVAGACGGDAITITLLYPQPDATEIKGSYDLHFGGDHVTGSFDAALCGGIAPPFGD